MATDRSARDTTPRPDLRERLVLALDVDDIVAATRLAARAAALVRRGQGRPRAVHAPPVPTPSLAVIGRGLPGLRSTSSCTTSRPRSAGPPRCVGALGASYLTMHAAGGAPMLQRRSRRPGRRRPPSRARSARRPGRDHPHERRRHASATCSATGWRPPSRPAAAASSAPPSDARRGQGAGARSCSSSCPGSGLAGRRATTRAGRPRPREALAAGADLLVIGRAVTAAADPRQAAAALVASLG